MSAATGRALRAGVIGLGWAGQQHMAAYADLDGVELVAIAGHGDRAARSARRPLRHRASRRYTTGSS